MALKSVIKSKEEFEKLPEAIRALYVASADGIYVLDGLDISEHPEVIAIKKNKDDILDEKKKLQAKMNEEEETRRKKSVEGHEQNNQFKEALELERAKFADEKAKWEANNNGLRNQLKSTLLDSRIDQLAMDLGGEKMAHLIRPHIASRLEVVEKDGKMNVFVKDGAGNVSSMTTEQLKKEFSEGETYAPFIKGRSSSGGGSKNDNEGGSTQYGDAKNYFDPKHKDYSITKQAELEVSDPTLYQKLSAMFNADDNVARALGITS